jgi:putative nucleotidyltransferase with HDIG domain
MVHTSLEVEELIDGTISIPTIPTVLAGLQAILESPTGSAKDAAKVIEHDPATATRVLRLVNSSFYGLHNPVSDINLACSILGVQVIKNLAVQATVLHTVRSESGDDVDAERLWDHSFRAAVACRVLAEKTELAGELTREDAYTCGLLHDVGKLILLGSQRDRFTEAVKLSRAERLPLARAEEQVFGFHHAHVGAVLAHRWRLPPSVQAAVRDHHDRDARRGALVKVANTYAHLAAPRDGGWRGDILSDSELAAFGLRGSLHAEVLRVTAGTRAV